MACALVPAQGRRSHCLDLTRSLLDLSWPPRSLLRTSRGCRRSSRRCGRPNCVPSASLCRKQGLCGRPASLRQTSWPRLAAPRCRPGHPLALVKPARHHSSRTLVGLGFDLGASGCARYTAALCGMSSTAGPSRRCARRCSESARNTELGVLYAATPKQPTRRRRVSVVLEAPRPDERHAADLENVVGVVGARGAPHVRLDLRFREVLAHELERVPHRASRRDGVVHHKYAAVARLAWRCVLVPVQHLGRPRHVGFVVEGALDGVDHATG
eukprot:scaffold4557_cov65-Phaeocystis_antarctica.AAC.3